MDEKRERFDYDQYGGEEHLAEADGDKVAADIARQQTLKAAGAMNAACYGQL